MKTDSGDLLQQFEVSAAQQRGDGNLRRTASVIVALACILLMLGRLPLAIALIGLTGLLVSVGWWRSGARSQRAAAMASRDGLWIHTRGMRWVETGVERWLDWVEVTDVRINEERLTIVLTCANGPDVTLEPRYRDTAVDELAHALAEAAGTGDPYRSQTAKDDLQ